MLPLVWVADFEIALFHQFSAISEKVDSSKPDSEIEEAKIFAEPRKGGFGLDAWSREKQDDQGSSE